MKSIIITTSKDVYNNNFEENNLMDGTLVNAKQIYGTLSSVTSLKGEISKTNDSIQGEIFSEIPLVEGVIIIQDALIGQLNSIFKIEGIIEVPYEQETEEYDFYQGPIEVTPSFIPQLLKTENKIVRNNIKVYQIKTYEVSNQSGTTFII